MTRSRLSLLLLLAPLGCKPGANAESTPPGEVHMDAIAPDTPQVQAPESMTEPPPVDLGPSDAAATNLIKVPEQEYQFPWRGRSVLFGKQSNGRLPAGAGRGGRLLVAIDTPYQLFARGSSYVHVAAWRTNGRPAAGARVFEGRREIGRTDRTGTLVVRRKGRRMPGDDEDFDDRYDGESTITVVDAADRCGQAEFVPYERTPTFASDHLFVYADRGVLRPGDTLHLRTIAWRLAEDYQPLVSAPVEFLLRDADGHTIAGGSRTTGPYGTGALDLAIPKTAREGLYTLVAAYGTEQAQARIQIRDFAAPVLQLQHTLGRFITRDQKTLAFELSLKDAQGAAVDRAQVRVSADVDGKRIASIEREITGAGPHQFALSKRQLQRIRRFTPEGSYATIEVEVVDALERHEMVRREMLVTANPWVAVLEADKDQYSTGDKAVIVARITDLDRVPLRNTDVTMQIGPGTTSKRKTLRTDKNGIATATLTMPDGQATAELFLPNVDKAVAKTVLSWVPPRAMLSELDEPVIGEQSKARIAVRFPNDYEPADGRVHLDITDTSGAIIGATVLAVTRDQGGYVARGEFVGPSWGSMLLTMFALGKKKGDEHQGAGEFALLTEGQNLVATPDRELEIVLRNAPTTVAPGAKLDIRAEVRTAKGTKANAELGVALVDASVLSLKDPLEITPMDEVYNPELRTLSTTGSKMLTWPVVTRNWGDHQMDVALPPFPALDGGEVNRCRGASASRRAKSKAPAGVAMGHASASVVGGAVAGKLAAKKSKPSQEPAMAPAEDTGSSAGPPPPPANGTTQPGPRPATRAAATPKITIRTHFPDTALWQPHLAAKDGSATIHGNIPDQISEQELIVVASDKRGGVGVARHTIAVRQPVHIRAQLPASMIVGEKLQLPLVVTNTTDKAAEFTVGLVADGNKSGQTKAKLGAGKRTAVTLPLVATTPGRLGVRATVGGAGHSDTAFREVNVRAAGVPVDTVQSTTLTSKSTTVKFDVAAAGNAAHLEVGFPAFTAAFAGLETIPQTITDDPGALAVDLTTASLLLHYAKQHRLNSPKLRSLHDHVMATLGMIVLLERNGGQFAWWRNGQASPYVSAWVLEGLLEARDADLPVPDDVIRRTATFVATSVGDDLRINVDDIGWWEGKTDTVQQAVTAEVFDILARVPDELISAVVRKKRIALGKHFSGALDRGELDSLSQARALSGLLWLGELDAKRAAQLTKQLVDTRDQKHWEPSWFHAYAGRIDATGVVLEVLQRAAPRGFAAEKRDALRWILATQEGWGQWHAERATASVVRALLAVGAPPSAKPSTVRVKVDGELIKTVRVDPTDPLLSTIALSHLDLGENFDPGAHTVTIDYDGKLQPTARLVVRGWQTGRTGSARADGNRLRVDASHRLTVDDRMWMKIRPEGPLRHATVHIAASGLLGVDSAALAARVGRDNAIASFEVTPTGLVLRLSPRAKNPVLVIPLRATRRGEGRLPAVALRRQSKRGVALQPLVVDPGTLVVQ